MKKRILSMVLCLCIICSILPVPAYAAEEIRNLDLTAGSVIITATGYRQGSAAEETPYTGSYSITQTSAETANIITVESGEIDLTISGLNVEPVARRTDDAAGSSVTVKSGAVLHLTVSGENTLKASDCHAGICVEVGATIHIYGDDSSVLHAVGSGQTQKEKYFRYTNDTGSRTVSYVFGGGAGIGGNAQHFKYTYEQRTETSAQTGVSFGTINVHSGTIYATGGTTGTYAGGGAGIGSGGVHSNLENNDRRLNYNSPISGTINITGGKVIARNADEYEDAFGGEDAAAIGTGGAAPDGIGIQSNVAINISGGTVDARSGVAVVSEGAGIGTGARVSGGKIVIRGGNITAVGGRGDKVDMIIGGAGIGCGMYGCRIDIEIHGGTVNAVGGVAGAGIGGNYSYQQIDFDDQLTEDIDIKISAGTVTATGGTGAAGIGGGFAAKEVNIEISGGVINAEGGDDAPELLSGVYAGPGIGNGDQANFSEAQYRTSAAKTIINISGGTITATGGTGSEDYPSAAGIGGGAFMSDVDSIIISNASVTANGGYQAAGIGGAQRSAVGTISITDGAAVYAYGGNHAKAIGVGYNSTDNTSLMLDDTVTLWASTGGTQTSALPAATTLSGAAADSVYLVSYTSGINSANTATATPLKTGASALNLTWTFTAPTLTLMQNSAALMSIDTKQSTLAGNWATILDSMSYTVAFDLNYAGAADVPPAQTIQHGRTVSEPEAPVRTEYTFVGWFTSADGGKTLSDTPYDFNTPVVTNFTLYAKWEEEPPLILPIGTAKLTKVDAEDPSKALPGAVFALYRASGRLVGTYTTNQAGEIKVYALLIGDYYWKEIQPAEGYVLDETEYRITVPLWQTSSIVVQNRKSSVPDAFTDEHYAYIIGYEDGMVHPEANITRAEVATIFFRLLDEDTRARYITRENSFSDVNEGDWFNTAVSTMAAMGIVTGRPGGIFDPDAFITRAEFAAIAARFEKNGNTSAASFADIYDHWAMKEINIAANNGWVLGYEDGTFRPDQNITRAEAMTMVNRVLQRIPETVGDLHPDMVVWPDNTDTTQWYYLMVQEATNSHHYVRKDNGYERWTERREAPDWAQLER